MKYTIVQGHPRGFLSTYVTLLTSFRYLLKRNVDINDIFIDENIFSLYGNIKNWFEYERVVSEPTGNTFNSMLSHKKEEWTEQEVNSCVTDLPFKLLNEYEKILPVNDRLKNKLKDNFNNCLGIHYRGTDHQGYHTIPVSMQTFLVFIEKTLKNEKFDSVFIASDEEQPFNTIVNYIKSKSNIQIIFNDFFRSKSKFPIHFTEMEPDKKIQVADEVLIDATMLSRCTKVIGRHSNILNYAWILNPELNVTYLDGIFKHV